MAGSRQREWTTSVLESAPSLIFLALWRSGVDVAFAGWIGAALAATVLIGFRHFRVPYNPILLGINAHQVVFTPLVVASFELGAVGLGRTLFASAEGSVLVAVFAVGCGLTAFSPRGFIGADGLAAPARRAYSLVLLAVAATAIPWSFAHLGQTLLSVALPLMALFGLRRLLIARWQDRVERAGGDSLAVAAMPAGELDKV
jgi:hypothetical protein